MSRNIEKIFGKNKIIPVVTIADAASAVPVANALLKGGITVIEVALRTDASLKALKEIKKSCKKIVVGAGTVTSAKLFSQAIDAGAEFIVSPGISCEILEKADKEKIPFLPGISTTSEIMEATSYGFNYLKFFPAELSGGVAALKNFSSIFKDVKFCPTGGINEQNFKKYLEMKNVFAVGGTWLTAEKAIKAKKWDDVTKTAKSSLSLIS